MEALVILPCVHPTATEVEFEVNGDCFSVTNISSTVILLWGI